MTISASRSRQNQQMLILRWILGSVSALALALSLYILLIERDCEFFRPLGFFLLLPLILATVLRPGATWVLHFTAVAALAVFLSVIPEILLRPDHSIAFAVLGLWLVYYWLHVWNGAGLTWFGYAILAAAGIATVWFGNDFLSSPPASFQRSINGMLLGFSLAALAVGGALAYFGRARS